MHKVRLVHKDLRVLKETQGHKGLKVSQVSKVQMVHKARLDLQVIQDYRVHKVIRVHKVLLDLQVIQVHKEHKVPQVIKVR